VRDVGLGEDGADRCGDHLRVPLGHVSKNVTHEMHPGIAASSRR
jgi:hypothetical protein